MCPYIFPQRLCHSEKAVGRVHLNLYIIIPLLLQFLFMHSLSFAPPSLVPTFSFLMIFICMALLSWSTLPGNSRNWIIVMHGPWLVAISRGSSLEKHFGLVCETTFLPLHLRNLTVTEFKFALMIYTRPWAARVLGISLQCNNVKTLSRNTVTVNVHCSPVYIWVWLLAAPSPSGNVITFFGRSVFI